MLTCTSTYGYITKSKRIELGLPKSHANDAFVIAGGREQEQHAQYQITQIRRNNRSLQMNRKGFKPSIRKQRYALQPGDIVRHSGSSCTVKGMFSYGKWVRLTDRTGNVVNAKAVDVSLVKYGKGFRYAA
jgi:hypothetical protein